MRQPFAVVVEQTKRELGARITGFGKGGEKHLCARIIALFISRNAACEICPYIQTWGDKSQYNQRFEGIVTVHHAGV